MAEICDLHERARGRLRIALTTNDLVQVDADFVSARQFVFYDVGADQAEFVDCIQFKDGPRGGGGAAEGGEKKGGGRCCGNAPAPAVGSTIDARIEALAGSSVLFTLGMSDPQSVRAADLGVFPVKLAGTRSIYEVLERLQEMLRSTPPLWLRRALRRTEATAVAL